MCALFSFSSEHFPFSQSLLPCTSSRCKAVNSNVSPLCSTTTQRTRAPERKEAWRPHTRREVGTAPRIQLQTPRLRSGAAATLPLRSFTLRLICHEASHSLARFPRTQLARPRKRPPLISFSRKNSQSASCFFVFFLMKASLHVLDHLELVVHDLDRHDNAGKSKVKLEAQPARPIVSFCQDECLECLEPTHRSSRSFQSVPIEASVFTSLSPLTTSNLIASANARLRFISSLHTQRISPSTFNIAPTEPWKAVARHHIEPIRGRALLAHYVGLNST